MKRRTGQSQSEQTQKGQTRQGREFWNAVFTTGLICAILLTFTAADLLKKDRVFSETENRLLEQKPEFSRESVLDGSFMKKYDKYVTDQFVGRDKWIRVKTRADLALQRQEINGVYLGKDDYLIEKHPESDFPRELVDKKLELLEDLVERWDAKVMLVPTADNILTDKLPAHAEYYDQSRFLQSVKERIGEENYIDVYDSLWEHRSEDIYYRTDHHWTSLGAYYGYLQWMTAVGENRRLYRAEREIVTEDFLGTLHSKINLPVKPDTIERFSATAARPVEIVYDMDRTSSSFYEERYLETKNKYGYFLDDNHGFVEIRANGNRGKTLFLIKDSFANCIIPLLSCHYEKIYVVDLRYMNGKLFPFMESYEPEDGMDVLVLYNCVHFIKDFRYW